MEVLNMCGDLVDRNESESVNYKKGEKTESLQPSDIRLLRLQYGLSTEQFSCVLGFKTDEIRELEKGKAIDKELEGLLKRLFSPAEMCRYLIG